MNSTLDAIRQRRAVKVFDPVDISEGVRDQILDAMRHAPSSFNMQPYKLYWIGTPGNKAAVAKLCLGQSPAETASALAVFVADLASLKATAVAYAEWMRANNFAEKKVREYEIKARIGRILFMPGPFGIF